MKHYLSGQLGQKSTLELPARRTLRFGRAARRLQAAIPTACNRVLVSALVALALSIAACNQTGAADGSATITWRVAPLDCAEVGLERVEVELRQSGELIDVASAQCEVRQVTFPTLSTGQYDVVVLGYPEPTTDNESATEWPIYEGYFSPLIVRSNLESKLANPIFLTARRAALYVSWHFDDARMCASNGVTDVDIQIYDEDNYPLLQDEERSYDCSREDYIASLEPEQREQAMLHGVYFGELKAGRTFVHVQAMNTAGYVSHEAIEEISLSHGETRPLELELESCGGPCG